MGYGPEQYKLDFGENKKKNPAPPPASEVRKDEIKVELHPNDECQNCGNAFESMSPGCIACRNNKAKIAYRIRKSREAH